MRLYFKSFLVSLCLHGLLLAGSVFAAVAVEVLLSPSVGSGDILERGGGYEGIIADLSMLTPQKKPVSSQSAADQDLSPHKEANAEEAAVRLGKKESNPVATPEKRILAKKKGTAREPKQVPAISTGDSHQDFRESPQGAPVNSFTAGDNGSGGGSGGGKSTSGDTDGDVYLRSNYQSISRLIQKNLEYPVLAKRRGLHGRAFFSFVVERNGVVANVRVVKSCGYVMLDEAGMRAIKAASPLPPPSQKINVNLPIDFAIRN